MFTLLSLSVADDPAVWESLGFHVVDSTVRIGRVNIVCSGSDAPEGSRRGIVGWTFNSSGEPSPGSIDGIPVTSGVAPVADGPAQTPHPNGVTSIDHLVVSTPDLDRTVTAFEAVGLECRRERERSYDDNPSATVRQAFFWLGDASDPADRVLCEVVGPKNPDPAKADRPASLFGLALTSSDLDATATAMGDLLKPPVTAVQAGRRIATVRSIAGSSVPIAIMSPHINPSLVDHSQNLEPS